MILHFPEGMRKNIFPETTKWFEKIMKTEPATKAYGRTILCKNPIKAFNGEIKRSLIIPVKKEKDKKEEDKNEEDKKEEDKKEEDKNEKKEYHKDETEEEKKARRKA